MKQETSTILGWCKMFRRDYTELNEIEAQALLDFKENLRVNGYKYFRNLRIESDFLSKFPAVEYYESLFPNNFMSYHDLVNRKSEYKGKLYRFFKLINNLEATEREILKYIKDEEAFFIVAAIAKKYTDWGHHDLYVFREFPIGTNYRADFMICGKNSFGYNFLFVEFEGVNGSIVTKKGEFGDVIRKGISQVEDWDEFLTKYFDHLVPIFNNKKNKRLCLPSEFLRYDPVRLTYCVVAGRRSNFNQKAKRKKFEHHGAGSKYKLLHYDNIFDSATNLLRDNLF